MKKRWKTVMAIALAVVTVLGSCATVWAAPADTPDKETETGDVSEESELKNIKVTSLPSKLVYLLGEQLNLDGMAVTAFYSNGDTEDVTEKVTVSGYDAQLLDQQTITVSYENMEDTFEISVIPQTTTTTSYRDVNSADWYSKAVLYVSRNKLMTGLKDTYFGAGENLARAQLAVILYRMEGKPTTVYTTRFSDIAEKQWFTNAVLWGNSKNIITGYSNGKFGPGDDLTREQMVAMMYRYADYKGKDVSGKENLDSFEDADSVSSFAEEAMQWAAAEGIITGKDSGRKLDPQGEITRAECAAIIMRFLEKNK